MKVQKKSAPSGKPSTKHLSKTREQDQAEQLHEILRYYRTKVDEFEKERVDWYSKLDMLRIKQEQSHKVEWELKKR